MRGRLPNRPDSSPPDPHIAFRFLPVVLAPVGTESCQTGLALGGTLEDLHTYTFRSMHTHARMHTRTHAHTRRGKRDRLDTTGSAGAAARLSPGPRERFRRPPCWRAHRRSLRPAGGTCLSPALCLFPACVSSIFHGAWQTLSMSE